MGQAQRNRYQGVQYRDVELELWELDNDENSYGRRNRNTGRSRVSSGNRPTGSNRSRTEASRQANSSRNRAGDSRRVDKSGQNIRAYEQRQQSVSQNRSRQNDANRNRGAQNRTTGRTGNRTGNQRPIRELQVQDIRRYQGSRAESRGNVRSMYVGNVRPVQSIKRRRARQRKVYLARMTAAMFVVMCLALIYFLTGEIYRMVHQGLADDDTDQGVVQTVAEKIDDTDITPPGIIEDYLDVNDYSRPGTPLNQINSIFVHYTANPRTSAAQNRSYFANLALTQERSASAHLIIGYEGEIIQCIPFDEQAYAVMTRNEDSISIECCYTSEDGSFTQETYDTLVHTLAWLLDKYNLSTSDILRHYDCGGKMCPLYYVEHEDAWEKLLADVENYEEN